MQKVKLSKKILRMLSSRSQMRLKLQMLGVQEHAFRERATVRRPSHFPGQEHGKKIEENGVDMNDLNLSMLLAGR